MATVLDDGVLQALNTGMAKEAQAAADSRTRSHDALMLSLTTANANYVSAPSVLAGQGIRMLNGTPGQFANATPAT